MTTDPGIILFGKKIGIPEYSLPFPTADDCPKTPSINEDDSPEKPQTLKKPDKILPCPRCESMNTKFCYYNNSNVNQPRHFCKSCQRYWTAGGTMRSMPVGAGRRKKKNTSSDCRFVISQQEVYESGPQIEFAADSTPTPKNILSFTPNSVVEKPQESNGTNGIFHPPQVSWMPYNYNPWVPMPIPFYPPPYWNSVPWLPNSTPTLGKHVLDRELSEQNEEPKKQKSSVLTPKTLRIDDPDEAAKSSIWVTLGIKNENSSRRDVFKGFQGDEKKKELISESSLLLQANPAAFSRSRCFQERV